MITTPKTSSYHTIFFDVNKGSSKAVKKAPILSIARVTETLDSLIAPKKVTQCKAITTPAIRKPRIRFRESEPLPTN